MWWKTLLAIALTASSVSAAPILKFDDPTDPGGEVSWAGFGGILGHHVRFQSILGLDTPLNSGVALDCVGCQLDFATGAITFASGPGGFLYTANPLGSIVMSGAVPALGLPAGTILLSGTFTGNPIELIGSGQEFGLFLGAGTDVKDATLAGFYGLDPLSFTFGTTSIQSVLNVDNTTGVFSGTVVNADLNNTAAVANPLSLVLLGLGLVAVRFVVRV